MSLGEMRRAATASGSTFIRSVRYLHKRIKISICVSWRTALLLKMWIMSCHCKPCEQG